MNGPNMDSERLLYDDGHSGCRRRGDRKNPTWPPGFGLGTGRSRCSIACLDNKLCQTPGRPVHVLDVLGSPHWRIADFNLYLRWRSTLLVAPRAAAEQASLKRHVSEPHITGDRLMVFVGLRYDVIALRRRLAQSTSDRWCLPPIGRHHRDDPESRRLRWPGCRRER